MRETLAEITVRQFGGDSVKNNVLIFVCGAAGSGKSTLVRNLKNIMEDTESISFDSYLNDTTCPPDYFNGSILDPSVIVSHRFVKDLQDLRNGKTVVDPEGNQKVPRKIILVDENFGRLRPSVTPLIDFQIYIEVPLDVLLARRVQRNINGDLQSYEAEQKLNIISNNLATYIDGFRNTFIHIQDNLPTRSDCVVNGMKSVDTLTAELKREINEFVSNFREAGNFS